jgi:phage tail protein X
MSETIRTVDGDRLDRICWEHYGSLEGRIVERVLDANPGISSIVEFSAGMKIFLPDIEPVKLERSLW